MAKGKPREHKRIGGFALETERRFDRTGAMSPRKEKQKRERGPECPNHRQASPRTRPQKPAKLAAQDQHNGSEKATEARRRGRHEQGIAPVGGELRKPGHKRSVECAQAREDKPDPLFACAHVFAAVTMAAATANAERGAEPLGLVVNDDVHLLARLALSRQMRARDERVVGSSSTSRSNGA